MARSRKRARSHGGAWALLAVVAALGAAGYWLYTQRRPVWNQAWTHIAPHPQSAAAPNGCAQALPAITGGALAASGQAKFITVEQLRQLPAPSMPAPVYRVQARLEQFQLEGGELRLTLGSLVNPVLTLPASIPADACAASQEDAALYDELREDFGLRFGPARAQLAAPAQPTDVVVTGVAAFGPHGIELRPVIDFHVQ